MPLKHQSISSFQFVKFSTAAGAAYYSSLDFKIFAAIQSLDAIVPGINGQASPSITKGAGTVCSCG